MNINFHIERLVLDGVSVDKRNQSRISADVISELVDLLVENGSVSGLQSSSSTPLFRSDDIAVEKNQEPVRLGQKIAGAIYRGIGK